MRRNYFFSLLIFVFSVSCHTSYKADNVEYSQYKIRLADGNSKVTTLLSPYADSVNKLMHTVIGNNAVTLERKTRQNMLGYFITDAYLEMARKKFTNQKIDAAFMNTGGVRLPDLPAGPITQGKIFELMPFDNLMVILKIKGSLLKQYLDTLAVSDGILESGMTMHVENKKVSQIIIGGQPLEENKEYTIVHSDYVVANTSLLKNNKQNVSDYLLRDAIIDYIKNLNAENRKITVINQDRINYAN